MTCPGCGTENKPGRKFCSRCGTPLALTCGECGAANDPDDSFCGECGSQLTWASPLALASASAATPSSARDLGTSGAERRLVSVLFADLVGFTTLSEARDSEEVRELLTRYFDSCRRVIARYGGVVEKFIGDAVMAVWGAPVAMEDDAERAVRASLELVLAVTELGEEIGAPDLRARAGVMTGEAAVMPGGDDQGMIAGDLVNTASRVQSVAEPGTVLVGESTRRASEAAIAYSDAGPQQLKGKAEPVPLFRALRVTAGRAGALKAHGLEPSFVGRGRELRLVKELFHASAGEMKAQLVSVVGIAGIGKTRLSWEFEKYIDGLVEDVWWHRGRCLAYGDGVAYWALAEMVRMRCRIAEDEEPASAREKLRTILTEHISDPEERLWVEPRLAYLLALEAVAPGDQENLFSAWRILFERLSEQWPTVLVFEDMQWADAGLLDFLEYLLEWARGLPLFVLVLARPEFAEKRPSWGTGRRGFSSLYLEPLSAQAMSELLTGLVPGLSDELQASILARAEGIPLYAVETVRMLLDRGLLVQEGNVYRLTGAIETLEVPETLHALIAARLDSLTQEERRMMQDASVLGKVFTKQGLTALTRLAEPELEPLLRTLVRKEMLSIQADPRSPEHGQYSFIQDLVRRVAYDTISKRERKTKHLAAAEFLTSVYGAEDDETIEVVASHYVDAYAVAPEDPDAEDIRSTAREMLVRAGERAASLAANHEAQGAFERALELTDDPLAQADLLEAAGVMAASGARSDEASAHFERASRLFEAAGATHPAARVSARLAEIIWERGRLEQGLATMDKAFAVLVPEEPDADLAALAAQIGRLAFYKGQSELALERLTKALEMAESLSLPETLSQALNTKAIILFTGGRPVEGIALLRAALDLALEHDKPSAALRASYNLADITGQLDRYQEASELVQAGLELARRVGNRFWEWAFLGLGHPLFAVGEWDEVLARQAELPSDDWSAARLALAAVLTAVVPVKLHRGLLEEAAQDVTLLAELESSGDVQERSQHHSAKAKLLLAQGELHESLRFAEAALNTRDPLGVRYEAVKEAFVAAVEAAVGLGDLEKAEQLLTSVESLPPGSYPQFLRAHAARFRARLGSERAEDLFKGAAALFREMGFLFYLAVTELELGEWLLAQGRAEEAEPLIGEARGIFEKLEAKPWLERTAHVLGAGRDAEAVVRST